MALPDSRRVKPWDENIGADASLVRVGGGKRQMGRNERQLSQVNLPFGAPFVEPLKKTLPRDVAPETFNADGHVWRSYRTHMTPLEDCRVQGKKVYSLPRPVGEIGKAVRTDIRQKLDRCDRAEATLRAEQELDRLEQRQRQENHKAAEETFFQRRVKTAGFEGLQRPTLRQPQGLPSIDEREVADSVARGLPRADGKRVVKIPLDAVQRMPAFGPVPGISTSTNRWGDKTLP